ncbi:MAG: aldo/keto reductase, partial [Lachnospiraceae bacterium]|nr:aldo/keto reductase [Lachnospiraceae bacterium]
MALAFVLHSKEVTSVLIGASKAEQILENLDSLKQPDFSEEELRRIDKISLPVARM